MIECVANVSEGRDPALLLELAAAAGADLLDLHRDEHHHRAVLTTVGEEAVRRVARLAVERIDLGRHSGVHPRLGAIDVVPFVPLDGSTMADACRARDEFADWAAAELGLPCFRYGGDGPTLPEVRRDAFRTLHPDVGPAEPHPTAGACAVGCRGVLVAYNLRLAEPDLELVRSVAKAVRGPAVRALGLPVGPRVQVSMNLIDPTVVGPAEAWDLVSAQAEVAGAELVGLVPAAVLDRVPEDRWRRLDLAADRTIESRLARR